MSFPNIPDITPDIDLTREDVINLLLASIAFEELGLAHLINAEAEKIQYILGVLEGQMPPTPPTISELLEINRSVDQTLRSVIKNQMLLQFKLEDTINILNDTTSTTTSTTTSSTTSTTTTTKCPTTTSTTTSTTSSTTSTTTTTKCPTTTTTTTTTTSSTTSTTTTTKCPHKLEKTEI